MCAKVSKYDSNVWFTEISNTENFAVLWLSTTRIRCGFYTGKFSKNVIHTILVMRKMIVVYKKDVDIEMSGIDNLGTGN